jgi:hypothetical protein
LIQASSHVAQNSWSKKTGYAIPNLGQKTNRPSKDPKHNLKKTRKIAMPRDAMPGNRWTVIKIQLGG